MKKIRLLAVLFAAALLLSACAQTGAGTAAGGVGSGTETGGTDSGAESGREAAAPGLVLATGGEQGTYYALGTALAEYVTSKGTPVTAAASQGSRDNIQALQSDRAQFAFVQSDVLAYAYEGENGFIAPVSNISTVCAMYMEQVQIVTLNPEIQSVSDLAGKTVSVGDAASGVYFNAIDILDSYGIDISTGLNAVYESFGDSTEDLKAGEIDAAFIVAGTPTAAVTDLAEAGQVYLVSLDDAHINALCAKSRYYSPSVIPAGTYSIPEDVSTVAVAAVIAARDDVSTEDVNSFVSAIFDNTGDLSAAHDKGAELIPDFAASVTAVPYHQGAYNYFVGKGYTVPLKEDNGI